MSSYEKIGSSNKNVIDSNNVEDGFTDSLNHDNIRHGSIESHVSHDYLDPDDHREKQTKGKGHWWENIFGKSTLDEDIYEMRLSKCLHFISFIIFLLSAIAIFILVGTNEFNVKTDFETDFITDKLSPRPTNNKLFIVGTPKTGWFVGTVFMWNSAIHFLILKHLSSKDSAGNEYHSNQIGKLYDMGLFWRYLGLSLLSVAVAAVIGVVNVFVFILIFVCVFGIGIKFHHEIPRLARDTLDSLFTITTFDKNDSNRNDFLKRQAQLAPQYSASGKKVTVQQKVPLKNTKHLVKDILMKWTGSKNFKKIKDVYYSFIKNLYAGIYTHFNAFLLWAIFFATTMSYYVSALDSASSTFSWWVHVGFWSYQFMIFLSSLLSFSYWSDLWRPNDEPFTNKLAYAEQNKFNFWYYIMSQYLIFTVLELMTGWFVIAGSNDEYGRLY